MQIFVIKSCGTAFLKFIVHEPNDGKRPRGRTSTKMEAKRDATTLALQETLKGFISQKDKAI